MEKQKRKPQVRIHAGNNERSGWGGVAPGRQTAAFADLGTQSRWNKAESARERTKTVLAAVHACRPVRRDDGVDCANSGAQLPSAGSHAAWCYRPAGRPRPCYVITAFFFVFRRASSARLALSEARKSTLWDRAKVAETGEESKCMCMQKVEHTWKQRD